MVVMRIWDPKRAALMFAPGKVAVTVKSDNDPKLASSKHGRIIQKIGAGARFRN
jgi:TATA-box binding protein (TBP) (component of TFIID and TFIIIB)